MQTYKVTLINKENNLEQTIEIPATESILDEAFEQGIKIPFECAVGSCGMCEGQLLTGTVDQAEQIFLSSDQVAKGLVVTCMAKPTSNCTLEVALESYL